MSRGVAQYKGRSPHDLAHKGVNSDWASDLQLVHLIEKI